MTGHPESRASRPPGTSEVRPRYARMVAAGGSALVTLVAVLGGAGLLPSAPASAGQAKEDQGTSRASSDAVARLADSGTHPSTDSPQRSRSGSGPTQHQLGSAKPGIAQERGLGVPTGSGTGRRVVFDMSDQRVWLVGRKAGQDVTLRTYLVSGSVTGNLDAGSYSVYSRSLNAWGVDDSGSMKYMVRFAHGARAAIGFHDIPVLDGVRVQSRAELGSPRSHGCIRQWRPDAQALWRFAPVGTRVVVLA